MDNLISSETAFNKNKIKTGDIVTFSALDDKGKKGQGLIVEANDWTVTVKHYDTYNKELHELIASTDVGKKYDLKVAVNEEFMGQDYYLIQKLKFNTDAVSTNQVVRLDNGNTLIRNITPDELVLIYVDYDEKDYDGHKIKTIAIKPEDVQRKKFELVFGEKGCIYC